VFLKREKIMRLEVILASAVLTTVCQVQSFRHSLGRNRERQNDVMAALDQQDEELENDLAQAEWEEEQEDRTVQNGHSHNRPYNSLAFDRNRERQNDVMAALDQQDEELENDLAQAEWEEEQEDRTVQRGHRLNRPYNDNSFNRNRGSQKDVMAVLDQQDQELEKDLAQAEWEEEREERTVQKGHGLNRQRGMQEDALTALDQLDQELEVALAKAEYYYDDGQNYDDNMYENYDNDSDDYGEAFNEKAFIGNPLPVESFTYL